MKKKPLKEHAELGIEAAPRRNKDIIDREMVRDPRISLRALGAATRLLSNAPGFRMTSLDLSRERKKGTGEKGKGEGRDAVRSALMELENVGYLQRFWERLPNGQCVTRMVISDVLPSTSPTPTPEKPAPAPTPEKPAPGFPAVGDSGSKSSNSSNRNISKKTTTTAASLDWSYIPGFNDEDMVVVVELVNELDLDLQQDLLDELAGALRKKGVIKTSWPGWFRSTVKNAVDGDFQLNHGLEIVRDRARRALEAAGKETARVAAAEAERRKSKLQERLNQMSDSEVRRALLVAHPELKPSDIDDWLQAGRPNHSLIASLARAAIATIVEIAAGEA